MVSFTSLLAIVPFVISLATQVHAAGRLLHPNGNTNECLAVGNGYAAKGTIVEIIDCFAFDDPEFGHLQLWTLGRDKPGQVKLNGTDYCLDAGNPYPANGLPATIKKCDHDIAQTWYYTDDNRISLYGYGYCLDVVAGSKTVNQNPYSQLHTVQIWKCTDGDTQQAWTAAAS
ncbi:carbohydrate-binding module family 13 protein [Athelia psychrophila]|uniref:Carbohydrate-binding module family 13 protein n=1 Tax=Athelia psychrophila TaxID=1759441 RepID=A0A165ZZK9_9AGAM|nr:carbohydrate-binding module family 13 protein [Fibularhizoctonia sp. CBS 109695]